MQDDNNWLFDASESYAKYSYNNKEKRNLTIN